MGNPNCCFMIIAVTFFFSSQSPRGTVGCINLTKLLLIAKVKDYIPYVGKTDQGVTFFLHPIHYLIMN
jgi:hypothetical protein